MSYGEDPWQPSDQPSDRPQRRPEDPYRQQPPRPQDPAAPQDPYGQAYDPFRPPTGRRQQPPPAPQDPQGRGYDPFQPPTSRRQPPPDPGHDPYQAPTSRQSQAQSQSQSQSQGQGYDPFQSPTPRHGQPPQDPGYDPFQSPASRQPQSQDPGRDPYRPPTDPPQQPRRPAGGYGTRPGQGGGGRPGDVPGAGSGVGPGSAVGSGVGRGGYGRQDDPGQDAFAHPGYPAESQNPYQSDESRNPADPYDPRGSRDPHDPYNPYQTDDDEPRMRSRSGRGARGGESTGPGRPGRAAARAGLGPMTDADPDVPENLNPDLDLDEVDPRGRAQKRAAKEYERRTNPRRRKAARITAASTAMLMVIAAGAGYYVIHHLLSNIQTVSLDNLKNRPAASKPNALGEVPLNILVLGSQTRDGQTEAVHVGNNSKDGTDLSDTAFVMHISADHKWAEVISIPRDLMVNIPSCQDRTNPTQTHKGESPGEFYDAMGNGGPACAVATVEQMTNIRIDHFVELTFDAFIDLTNAVNGVQICVPSPGINDPNYSGLVLSAGYHTVSGNQALAFVRDRHGLVSGEDVERIKMQQMFMSSLFSKLTSNGTVEDPVTLYKIASAVSNNVTVDTAFDNIGSMISVVEAVGSISKSDIQYVTAPYITDSPGQYSYDEHGAHLTPGDGFQQLWTYMRNDQPLPGSAAASMEGAAASEAATRVATHPSAAPSATPSAKPTIPLSSLNVQVFNGTSIQGEAKNAAAYLKNLGMTTSIGYSGYTGYSTTTVLYPANDAAQAAALQAQIAGSVLKQSSSVSQLTLVIGTNAPAPVVATQTTSSSSNGNGSGSSGSNGSSSGSGTNGKANAPASPAPTLNVESRTGNENICSNLPGVVSYGGAPSD